MKYNIVNKTDRGLWIKQDRQNCRKFLNCLVGYSCRMTRTLERMSRQAVERAVLSPCGEGKGEFPQHAFSQNSSQAYSTSHGHYSITCVFHAWKSAILHANSTRKTRVKHSCKRLHAKIHEKIHVNQENLRVKLYSHIVKIWEYSVSLSSYIAG